MDSCNGSLDTEKQKLEGRSIDCLLCSRDKMVENRKERGKNMTNACLIICSRGKEEKE